MRTLIYKRTHKGDPDKQGRFGVNDCMGRVRSRDFEAVIGIGGIGSEAKAAGIDGRLNWIGIGPQKEHRFKMRAPLVTFAHFLLFDEQGTEFKSKAPTLAQHLYSRNVRVLSNFNECEQQEIDDLLRIAQTAPPSSKAPFQRLKRHCLKCCRPTR